MIEFNKNYNCDSDIFVEKLIKESIKFDLILKTKNLGYNIFDLNDSFYNDICSVFSYNDSDFSLSERKSLLDLSDENLCMIGRNRVTQSIVPCDQEMKGISAKFEIIIPEADDSIPGIVLIILIHMHVPTGIDLFVKWSILLLYDNGMR